MAGSEFEDQPRAMDMDNSASAASVSANAPELTGGAELDLDDVIARLDVSGNKLPKEAIRDARRLRPQIIPRLIELIEKATVAARSGSRAFADGAFYALYLLTEFRAKEALPTVLDAVYVPEDTDFFGDAVTSDFGLVLAVLAADDQEAVGKLIDDPNADLYARWAAASTYKYWVRDGLMTREQAVARLRQHLILAMPDQDTEFIAGLVCCLGDFGAVEAAHEIREAFERDRVDLAIVDQGFIESQLAEPDENFRVEVLGCSPSGIEDTIEHLSPWHYYREPEPSWRSSKPAPAPIVPAFARAQLPERSPPKIEPTKTIRSTQSSPGRNDPCPCGSGKKYKKCCALKQP